jgi:uncharacterized repeat protein (TIGR04052 family)
VRLHLAFIAVLLLLSTSCSEPYLGVKIPFVVTWGENEVHCDGTEIALTDLRLYVSEIELLNANGEAHELVLQEELPWQQPDLAFIDLEDRQGACSNGTSEIYAYLVGSIPAGEYMGLRFTVGVPFERNHSDPLRADAPLDDPAMHWHWRSGYKFLRAGVKSTTDGFWIHVGSAGCEGTVRDISACRFPNRIPVELGEFSPGRDAIAVDLKELFGGTDLTDGVPTDCSSGPPETACNAPFAALGIDFESGKLLGQQRVFRIDQ